MLHRFLRCSRAFSSKTTKKTLMAIIGNNPHVPEYINKLKLDKYMSPVYFQNEEEMMKPGDYESALIVNSNPKQMELFLKFNCYNKICC